MKFGDGGGLDDVVDGEKRRVATCAGSTRSWPMDRKTTIPYFFRQMGVKFPSTEAQDAGPAHLAEAMLPMS